MMTTLTVTIPDHIEKTLSDLVKQLGGEVIAVDTEQELNPSAKKEQILNDLEKSATFVKLHKQGKVKAKSIEQLLNEL